MLSIKETQNIIEFLSTAEPIDLSLTKENDNLLKIVVTGDFTLITFCKIEIPNRRFRSSKDFELLYCSSSRYVLSGEDFMFHTKRYYEKVSFYKIPKKFFPEYYL